MSIIQRLSSIVNISLAIVALALPASAAPPSYQARVVSIADGDTITVLDADNRQVKIRLYGIDCPEKRQPYGTRARQATADAVMGKTVNVHPIDTDRYGRTVALVAVPGREMLNGWLVKEGLAWVYPQFCRRADICDRLRELERAAKEGKKGLWQDKEPVEPWVWRKGKR
ncbi:MAG: thermonuclease family protein [Desulfovibrio sp.]|jgi:endonuclease YncB( thermonuclease family)|nr:thermonuclease family protein [Desulfovibrio sp.]